MMKPMLTGWLHLLSGHTHSMLAWSKLCNVDSCWMKWMHEIPTLVHGWMAAWRWKGNSENKLIDMAFNKGRADDRKTWMNKYQALNCNIGKWWTYYEKSQETVGTLVKMLSGLQAQSQAVLYPEGSTWSSQVKPGRRVLLWTTPSEPSHMKTLCKA